MQKKALKLTLHGLCASNNCSLWLHISLLKVWPPLRAQAHTVTTGLSKNCHSRKKNLWNIDAHHYVRLQLKLKNHYSTKFGFFVYSKISNHGRFRILQNFIKSKYYKNVF